MLEYALLLIPLLVAWFAYDAMRVRETAIGLARGACERQGVQFLDFTVQGAALRLGRNAEGRAAWRRSYDFEFSEDGRYLFVVSLGDRPQATLALTYRHTGPPSDELCFQGVEEEFEQVASSIEAKNKGEQAKILPLKAKKK